MLKGLYIVDRQVCDLVYPGDIRAQIEKEVEIIAPPMTKDETDNYPDEIRKCEVVFSGWGCPKLDKKMLDKMPKLKAVFYGAGSIKAVVSEEFWARDILIVSAYGANAVPVAEYTLSQILFCLKDGHRYAASYKKRRGKRERHYVQGCYKSSVGIISLGRIGRLVCEHLRHFDMNVMAYDPFVKDSVFEELGAERLDTLEEIFKRSDVISLHTPWLPETEGMITGRHFEMMKENAVFINTSRGAVVKENEITEVLLKRRDLFAVLDVTFPEPPDKNSPLFKMDNVLLTPHIAGSMYNECERMAQYMADELCRWVKGEELKYSISKEKSAFLA